MGRIEVLDSSLINMIAAGEVVERISSVVKELVENAIDAGSNRIKISLMESGLSEIRVADNGCGMDARDAEMAILPHATSKIRTKDDLFSIRTLGFRGEALASIAAVSNFKIITSDDGYHGVMRTWREGKPISIATLAHPKGTDVIVKNLFFNTPVRLQSLQSQNIELGYVVDYVSKIALARPDIAFELYNNNKVIIKTYGSNDILETIYAIYGAKVAKNMVSIFDDNGLFKVNGFVSKIEETRSTKNNIVLTVNGRVIKNMSIVNSVISGYGNKLMNGRYPIALINIKVDTTMVDVNIHPSKLEVRFASEDKLKELIKNIINKTLNMTDLSINIDEESNKEVDELKNYTKDNLFSRYKQESNVDEKKEEFDVNAYDVLSTLDNIGKAEEEKEKKKDEPIISSPFEEEKQISESDDKNDETNDKSNDLSFEEESEAVENESLYETSYDEMNDGLINDLILPCDKSLDESIEKIEQTEIMADNTLDESYDESNDESYDELNDSEELDAEEIPFEYESLFDDTTVDEAIEELLEIDRKFNEDNYNEEDEEPIEIDEKTHEVIYLNEDISKYETIFDDEITKEKVKSVDFDVNEAEIGLSEKINSKKVKYEQLSFENELNLTEKDEETVKNLPFMNYIGQLFGTYILCNDEKTFYLVDQHAAMERINYEKIKKNLSESDTLTYDLLVPFTIEFSPKESYLVRDCFDEINKLGIELEEFGANSFIVRKIPTWIFRGKEKEFVEEIVAKIIQSNGQNYDKAYFLDSLSKSLACKKSIKGNEFHNKIEIEYLLEELAHTSNPYTCPHGRPVIVKLTKTEVDKWFKRVVEEKNE